MLKAQQLTFYATATALLLVPVVFVFGNFNAFDLPKQLLFHAIVWLMLIVATVNSLSTKTRLSFSRPVAWPLVAILLVWLLAGYLGSTIPSFSWLGNYFRFQGIYSYLFYWLWFLVVAAAQFKLEEWRRLLGYLNWGAALVVVYAVFQYLGWDFFHWNKSDNNLFSTQGQRNFLGLYLAMVVPLTTYTVYRAKASWQRIAGLVLVLGELWIILNTFSRSSWLGVLAALLTTATIWLWYKRQWRWRLGSVFAAILLVLATLVWQAPTWRQQTWGQGAYVNRFLTSFSWQEGSGSIRRLYWRAAWQEFQTTDWRHRLFGYGKDCQELVFMRHYDANWSVFENLDSFPDRAHNWLIDNWLEFGLVGLLAVMWLWLVVVSQTLKTLTVAEPASFWLLTSTLSALAAYSVALLFGFGLTTHFMLLWFLLALLLTLSKQATIKPLKITVKPEWLKVILLVLVSTMIASLFLVEWSYFLADRQFFKAKQAESQQDFRGIIDYSQAMYDLFPQQIYFRNRYLYFLSNAMVAINSKESLEAAEYNINQAISGSPSEQYNNYFSLQDRARAYSVLGKNLKPAYFDLARKDYERLVAMAPNIAITYQDYGRMEFWSSDLVKARTIYQQGLAKLPALDDQRFEIGYGDWVVKNQYATFYNLLGDTYLTERNWAAAEHQYLQAYDLSPDSSGNLEDLVEVYKQRKQYRQALKYATRARIAISNETKWSSIVAELYFLAGDYRQAKLFADEALGRNPNDLVAIKIISEIKQLKK